MNRTEIQVIKSQIFIASSIKIGGEPLIFIHLALFNSCLQPFQTLNTHHWWFLKCGTSLSNYHCCSIKYKFKRFGTIYHLFVPSVRGEICSYKPSVVIFYKATSPSCSSTHHLSNLAFLLCLFHFLAKRWRSNSGAFLLSLFSPHTFLSPLMFLIWLKTPPRPRFFLHAIPSPIFFPHFSLYPPPSHLS